MKNQDQCMLNHGLFDEKIASYELLLDELTALRDDLVMLHASVDFHLTVLFESIKMESGKSCLCQ